MTLFDPRLTPARPDIAAKRLEGTVVAQRFVEGEIREVIEPHAPVRDAPGPDAALATEALMGERVIVYEITDEGWAWCQLQSDGYVGWLPANALGIPGPAPTHKVVALRTLIFPGPSITLPPLAAVPLGARLAVARTEGRFAATAGGGFVPAAHLAPVGAVERDFVAVAERFIGLPYLWGGKTSLGIDCSGLVQVSLNACGIDCPRDTDMQEHDVGTGIEAAPEFSNLRRGDLVFWKRHVAIVRDPATLVHANAYHMAVMSEPTDQAIARNRDFGFDVTSVRRLSPSGRA